MMTLLMTVFVIVMLYYKPKIVNDVFLKLTNFFMENFTNKKPMIKIPNKPTSATSENNNLNENSLPIKPRKTCTILSCDNLQNLLYYDERAVSKKKQIDPFNNPCKGKKILKSSNRMENSGRVGGHIDQRKVIGKSVYNNTNINIDKSYENFDMQKKMSCSTNTNKA